MEHVKVKINPLNIEGVVLWVSELKPNTEYLVRYKGNLGGMVSKVFKSNQLELLIK